MISYLCLILLSIQILRGHGFYHLSSMVTLTPAEIIEDALFGYSSAYQQTTNTLFIGAPRADNVGQIYSVNLTNAEVLQKMEVKSLFEENVPTDTNFWLGATVGASADIFVTCAPRYTSKNLYFQNENPKRSFMTGTCYVKSKQEQLRKMPEITKTDRRLYTNNRFEDQMDTLGWNMQVFKTSEVLIGGPAMNRGRVSQYTNPLSNKPPTLIHRIDPINYVKYNFGYNIAMGNFVSNETFYVISSPFGSNGIGKINYFTTQENQRNLNKGSLSDDQVGNMYGASLCAARLVGDSLSLLVGAPTYSDSNDAHDTGAVYVYIHKTKYALGDIIKRIVKGYSNGGYFGYAMANLGDMDADLRDEIAIAAPYENGGEGAVYVYSGKSLLYGKSHYQQRIKPEGFRAFGLSLTSLKNYNNNGCSALAVGAPDSNKVVVLKCFSSVTVKLRFRLANLKLEEYTDLKKQFEFEVCLDVTYPDEPEIIKADIEVTAELTHPNSKLVMEENGRQSYTVSLEQKLPSFCKNISAKFLRVPDSGHFQVMTYKINAKLLNNPEEQATFDPARVGICNASIMMIQGDEWSSSCDGGICNPLLTPQFTSMFLKPYVLGSSSSENISISIHNEGQTAYSSCAVINTADAYILKLSSGCTRDPNNEDNIICKQEGTLLKGDYWNINNVELDTSFLTSGSKVIVTYIIYPNCKNMNEKKTYIEEITSVADLNFGILSQSNPDEVVTTSADNINTEGRKIQHVYTIINDGVTNWIDIKCIIEFNSTIINFAESFILAYPETDAIECSLENRVQIDNVTRVACDIGDLRKRQKTVVTIGIDLMRNVISDKKVEYDVPISTSLIIDHNEDRVMSSLLTIIRVQTVLAPLWITIVSSVVGLILLFIIAFILYKCGFLRRKKKEELQTLKREQTIRRMTIRESRINCRNENQTHDQIEE